MLEQIQARRNSRARVLLPSRKRSAMRKTTVGVALVCMLAAGPSFAHHGPAALGTVRITQPVLAGGMTLQPGTYEIRDTGEHGTPLPGQAEDAQAVIEFVANGMVVARDLAEVMPGRAVAVGTSGSSRQPIVQMLKGGDFMRISKDQGGERFLIHLRVAGS